MHAIDLFCSIIDNLTWSIREFGEHGRFDGDSA